MFDVAEVQDNPQPIELYLLARAFARIRGIDRIEDGAILSRHWLAADMGVELDRLDRRLRLLRWSGLVDLEGEHLVIVKDAAKLRKVAAAAEVAFGELTENLTGPMLNSVEHHIAV